jgi:hypothetical protein
MEFIPAVVLVALIKSFVDLAKRLLNKEYKPVATQLLSYLAGVGVVVLFSKTACAASLAIGGVTLAGAGLATCAVIGIALASTAGLAADALSAVSSHTQPRG